LLKIISLFNLLCNIKIRLIQYKGNFLSLRLSYYFAKFKTKKIKNEGHYKHFATTQESYNEWRFKGKWKLNFKTIPQFIVVNDLSTKRNLKRKVMNAFFIRFQIVLTIRRWLLALALAIELFLWMTELLLDKGFEPCYSSVS